jgi:hypothetical protein
MGAAPDPAVMPEMSEYIAKIENAPDLEAHVINDSKLHKVFNAFCKLESIPRDDEFDIRLRSEKLLVRLRALLESPIPANEINQTSDILAERNPEPVEPEKAAVVVPDDADQTPQVCITQLTTGECLEIKTLAANRDQPLDPAVVELLCILPHFSCKLKREQ